MRKHDNGEKNQFRLHDNEPSGSLLAVLPVPYLLPVTSCSSSPTLCGFPIFDIADKSRSNLNKTIMPSRPLRPAQTSSSSERAHARAVLPTQAFPTSIGEKMATVSTVVRWHDVLSLRLAPVLLSLPYTEWSACALLPQTKHRPDSCHCSIPVLMDILATSTISLGGPPPPTYC